jgi:uncharacterized membrane protein YphA (DoxX/SURF4 family)
MNYSEILMLVGRLIFGGYFIYNGVQHFTGLQGLAGYAESKKVPLPKLAVILTGLMLFLGGAGIVLWWYVDLAIILLAVFMLVVTLTMHRFWTETDASAKSNAMLGFYKNSALFGALLLLLGLLTY